jgi:serine protease AprX
MAKKSSPRTPRSLPPANPVGLDSEGRLDEATLRRFVFQTFGRARRTQDSPVMPDVWLRYIRVAERIARARPVDRSIDLLLTPWSGVRPGAIADQLRRRLQKNTGRVSTRKQQDDSVNTARIALSESRVVACADFRTLVRDVVPLTGWWQRLWKEISKKIEVRKFDEIEKEELAEIQKKVFEEAFDRIEDSVRKTKMPAGLDIELSRYAALVGFIDHLREAKSRSTIRKLAALAYRLGPPTADAETEPEELEERRRDLDKGEEALLLEVYECARRLLRPDEYAEKLKGIFLISLNRRASQTLFESRSTVKADAAHNVFDINTSGIVFAVIDGGVDATHPAFQKQHDNDTTMLPNDGGVPSNDVSLKSSRVIETYDFTILRDIIAHAENPQRVKGPNCDLIKLLANDTKHKLAFEHLAIRNKNARDLDWEIVRPLIGVPHEQGKRREKDKEYRPPGTDHGTHVAGILAANLSDDPESGRALIGMCPQLSLYDLRVFDQDGRGDEFAILCALEFVGWLNRDRANPVVHGVNLSLALAHDVDSFACGQTPICEACNHLVGAGTVVVAAAGNTGFEGGTGAKKQSFGTGYRPISITDPGNADNVITVGSTHRRDPHLYGVSYFSARGPTGDGRRKPDILAPGEKITSTIRDGGSQRMDGTSMAAPHVAGAAALLMARYPELIGRPLRIKEILMRTATDLNREASFQGAGLVDVLRALQSV